MADSDAQEKFLAERAKMKTQYEQVRHPDRRLAEPALCECPRPPSCLGGVAALLQELAPVSCEALIPHPRPLPHSDVPRCRAAAIPPHSLLEAHHEALARSPPFYPLPARILPASRFPSSSPRAASDSPPFTPARRTWRAPT